MSRLPPFKVPREHGAFLSMPSLAEVPALVRHNQELFVSSNAHLLGRSLASLRQLARHEIRCRARDYLAECQEPLPTLGPADLILLSGHQPELFHPGVWVKNFALAGLAQALHGEGINLQVDYDAVKTASLLMPNVQLPLPPAEDFLPRSVPVAYDRVPLGTPHEEWYVQDEALFASLPERAAIEWNFPVVLSAFWSGAGSRASVSRRAMDRLTGARRSLERAWGCHNHEVPVSRVCQGVAFAWFVADILVQLPRFHAIYNTSVREYRRLHRLKSRHHPVPDLDQNGDWLEAPFWAWRQGDAQRGRLRVRQQGQELHLQVGRDAWPTLPAHDGEALVRAFHQLEGQGYKLRPRALTNTLFARLFVADLFLHGVGGGKYDEVTDNIARRYFGIEPPAYLVLSGTLLLPFPHYRSTEQDERRLLHLLRDQQHNPQRHLPLDARRDPLVADLLDQKERWMRRRPEDRAGRRQRFRTLKSLTEQLSELTRLRRQQLQRELDECRAERTANGLLLRRDFAFCLYPEEELRRFCTGIMHQAQAAVASTQ